MRLNLGANDDAKVGYRSVNLREPADDVCDLSNPWPWKDSTVEAIYAKDVFEHIGDGYRLWKTTRKIQVFDNGDFSYVDVLTNVEIVPYCGMIHVMNEAHRVLVPGGRMELVVPCLPGKAPWVDPTHRSVWCSDTRYYFDERWNNPEGERGRLGQDMGITALFRTVGGRSGQDWTPVAYAADDPDRRKLFLELEAVK